MEVEAAKQARFISAFNPEDIPGGEDSRACLEVAAFQNQLEEAVSSMDRRPHARGDDFMAPHLQFVLFTKHESAPSFCGR